MIAGGLLAVLFWTLRISYWSTVTELPFSDMADFDRIAHQVAATGNFAWSNFWQTYSTPTLVAMRAFELSLFGSDLIYWQFFQTALLWCALIWLSIELARLTKQPWLSILLITVVALSKPSIFWSLKLSRESIHEMFIYATAAAFLFMLRKERWWAPIVFGVVSTAGVLNRANMILILPLAIAVYVCHEYLNARRETPAPPYRHARPIKRVAKTTMLAVAGIALVWGPWIVRNYNIYGEIVPLSTQGPYGLLWDLGRLDVRLADGSVVITHVNELQATASQNFKTDLEASRYAGKITWAWIQQNYDMLPRHIMRRLKTSVTINAAYLSKVSRTRLFENAIDHTILIDKSILGVLFGCAGLLLLPLLYPFSLAIVPVMALAPWLTGAAIVGYPRMLDPSLPLIMFGNAFLILAIVQGMLKLRRR